MKLKIIHLKNGFTLMEAMITIAVIGILAMIAVPLYSALSIDEKIKIAEVKSEIRRLHAYALTHY